MTTFFLHEQFYRDLNPAVDKLITICGAGALGANLAETLARMGLKHLRVIDRDRVEARNLSTQPWLQQDVGAPKVRILANALYRAVGARVEPQAVELTETNAQELLAGSAVVVDAFDNIPARHAVMAATAVLEVPCLHVALAGDGLYGCGCWDAAYHLPLETPPGMDGCDYGLSRPLAMLCANASAEVLVRHLLDGDSQGFEITLRDLTMQRI